MSMLLVLVLLLGGLVAKVDISTAFLQTDPRPVEGQGRTLRPPCGCGVASEILWQL